MAESCTFVPSPYKPSHCKLCFKPKVDHKIPVLKVEQKPVHAPVHHAPVNATSPTPTPTPVETKPVKSYKYQEYQPPKLETKPVETKPAKVYKYQLNPQNPQPSTPVQETKPVETKPAKVYKYQLNPQQYHPESNSPKFSISDTIVEEKPSYNAGTTENVEPKKAYVPRGAIKMQGFDPMMLAGEAQKRRAKKNLEEGALEETCGLVKEPEKKPEELWETPQTVGATRIGPGLGMIGGAGLTAALQKRKEKVAAAEALENPNAGNQVASTEVVAEEVVEETISILPSRMKEVMQRIETVPHELLPEDPPRDVIHTEPTENIHSEYIHSEYIPETTHIPESTGYQNTHDDDNDDDDDDNDNNDDEEWS